MIDSTHSFPPRLSTPVATARAWLRTAIRDPDGAWPRRGVAGALFVALALAVAAEAFVYGFSPGFGLALCAALTAAAVFGLRRTRLRPRARLALAVAVATTLLAVAEEATTCTLTLAVLALALTAASFGGRRFGDLVNRLLAALGLVARAPRALWVALRSILAHAAARDRRRALRDWIAPLALGAVFAALFAAANPLLARLVDLPFPSPAVVLTHVALWTLFGGVAAVFVAARAPAVRLRNVAPGDSRFAALFGEGAVLRGLFLFNALFAIQTTTDAMVLSGGAALPAGMTYAEYAHRGAYPLVVAALLAGGVALIAMRPVASARVRTIRALTLVFVVQTVALVASAALRLDLYVSVYGLTPWRVAAFLWMGLVAFGLTLILVAMATGRSRRWLASTNVAAALAALLIGATLDPGLIADHNLRRARETGGSGVAIDLGLIGELGPSALPAIDRLVPRLEALGRVEDARRLQARRAGLLQDHQTRMADWRSRSFRMLRLQAQLDRDAAEAAR